MTNTKKICILVFIAIAMIVCVCLAISMKDCLNMEFRGVVVKVEVFRNYAQEVRFVGLKIGNKEILLRDDRCFLTEDDLGCEKIIVTFKLNEEEFPKVVGVRDL